MARRTTSKVTTDALASGMRLRNDPGFIAVCRSINEQATNEFLAAKDEDEMLTALRKIIEANQ